MISFLLRRMKKTLISVAMQEVRLKQTKEVTEVFKALSSCEVLEVLHLESVYIHEHDFRFVIQHIFFVI